MSLTLSNVNLLKALNTLSRVSKSLDLSNERLSTNLRINRASDDPAGLIAASMLSQEMAKLSGQMSNAQRIGSQIDTADGALTQISSLITDIQTNLLAASDSTASEAEKEGYQQSIDLAIDSIDRLVAATTFNGKRLLDGTLGYSVSGVSSSQLSDVRITSSNRSMDSTMTVVATSAVQATLTFSDATVASDVAFTITGPDGSEAFNFSAGTTKAEIASAVAAASGTTGVTAADLGGGDPIEFKTVGYGSDYSFSVHVTEGTFTFDEGTAAATGTDSIVTVNGTSASVSGQTVYFNANGVAGSFTMTDSFHQAGGTSAFTLSGGGGAGWRLDGSASGTVHLGLSSLRSSALGTVHVGYLSSLKSGGANDIRSGNLTAASEIVSAASSLAAREQGRLGTAKKYAVDSTVNALQSTYTATAEAKSRMMDTDYLEESANNTRLAALMQVGVQVISAMNTNTAMVMKLLGLGG